MLAMRVRDSREGWGRGAGQEGAPNPPRQEGYRRARKPRAVNSAPRCDEMRGRTPFERAHSQVFSEQGGSSQYHLKRYDDATSSPDFLFAPRTLSETTINRRRLISGHCAARAGLGGRTLEC